MPLFYFDVLFFLFILNLFSDKWEIFLYGHPVFPKTFVNQFFSFIRNSTLIITNFPYILCSISMLFILFGWFVHYFLLIFLLNDYFSFKNILISNRPSLFLLLFFLRILMTLSLKFYFQHDFLSSSKLKDKKKNRYKNKT